MIAVDWPARSLFWRLKRPWKCRELKRSAWLLIIQAPKRMSRRFAESQGHQVTISEEKGVFELKIRKGKGKEKSDSVGGKAENNQGVASSDIVVFIDTDSLGRGSEELGKILMRSFLQTLEQSEVHPQRIILINSGVKLACEGSEVLEDLQEFAAKGLELLSCGTCLDYFGIKKKLMVGKVSNMYEIINSLMPGR